MSEILVCYQAHQRAKGDYYRERLERCQQFLQDSGKPVWGTLDEIVVELPAEKKAKK